MERLETIVETYFSALRDVRGSGGGTKETSYYPALSGLLSELGRTLRPHVVCVIQIQNHGAGLPDGGLFTKDQLKRVNLADATPFFGQLPARGVLEVKAPSQDLAPIVESEQVGGYWKKYGLVLVTNLRQFALVGRSPSGSPVLLEGHTVAASEAEFWTLVEHPRAAAASKGLALAEYLRRVLLHNAPLGRPQDVAAILAAYARDAKLRVDRAGVDALGGVRQALEEALGLRFVDEKGEHFFRSTLVQTLFYGVFSAWVLWARKGQAKPATFKQAVHEPGVAYGSAAKVFDWRVAQYLLRVPMIRALFVQVADPAQLGALGLVEVLDWTAAALNRVDREVFFESFDEGRAVQYFYEPFLEAFDPELRKELGVWYTPEEIVRYQVERVDTVLREELDIADGLADPRVIVLDPCCGTGAYLHAVLGRIAATLHGKGGDALVAHDLKKAAIERVFGFEILPAPFVVAHLQLSLLLEHLGAPLSEAKAERPGVYLTNALTGWEPPKEKPKQIAFPGFDEERDAAGRVKQEKPILVILGNPPYNAFAGVSPAEENDLVEPYKKGLNTEWGIKKFNLDDLYVRFFRLAEKRIAETGGRGVVSFISNFSYLADPSYVVMRRHFLDAFDAAWLDCLNGDSRETGKQTPDGKPDPSVFSTDWSREGIRVGTAVGLFVKVGPDRRAGRSVDPGTGGASRPALPRIRFRHFWGTTKRADLLASLDAKKFNAQYEAVEPRKENRWSFRPSRVANEYLAWPRLPDLCSADALQGMDEDRASALISVDQDDLVTRMRSYFDSGTEWSTFATLETGLSRQSAAFDPKRVRARALREENFTEERVRRYVLRPLDNRWCYYSTTPNVWKRQRPELWRQLSNENAFLISRSARVTDSEGVPFFYTRDLLARDSLRGHAVAIPLRLNAVAAGSCSSVYELPGMTVRQSLANLSPAARAYLESLGFQALDTDPDEASNLWMHALAIGYSQAYLEENADGIRGDWPRIPLPKSRDTLLASAALGRQVAALLDVEAPVPGVTAGKIRPELRDIAVFARADGKPAQPDAGDLDVTAGWGHGGKGGVTMPGRGKLSERRTSNTEHPTSKCGQGSENDGAGAKAWDVWLNDVAMWRNVPDTVWEFTIGGYQVIKKWLSYREKPLLDRGLTVDEVRYVTEMARRLAALVALRPALDANYAAVKDATK